MKRSKVFLGVTSCLLAIAGFAAAKTHFAAINLSYWTAQGHSPQGRCIQDSKQLQYTTTPFVGQTQLQTFYGGTAVINKRNLYTDANCTNQAYFGQR